MGPTESFAAAKQSWSSEPLPFSAPVRVGDVNGDGRDDLVILSSDPVLIRGIVDVELSTGGSLARSTTWSGNLCTGARCTLADADGDGDMDIFDVRLTQGLIIGKSSSR